MKTHENRLNVVGVLDYEVKLGKDFQQEAEGENSNRPDVHHPFGCESNQGQHFVIDIEKFVFGELRNESFHGFLHAVVCLLRFCITKKEEAMGFLGWLSWEIN